MALVDDLRARFGAGEFEFSQHALDQMLRRDSTLVELLDTVRIGELIEDYPQDKYGPSCLVLGWTDAKRPLHVQCSYPSRPLVKVITVYEPDSNVWINFRERKQ